MSNFIGKVKRPDTGEIVEAEFLDNYFGHRIYGMRIKGEEKVRKITASNRDSIVTDFNMTFKRIRE